MTLKYDKLLSSFAFNLKLRRYIEGVSCNKITGKWKAHGRAVQAEPMKPVLKAPGPWNQALKTMI